MTSRWKYPEKESINLTRFNGVTTWVALTDGSFLAVDARILDGIPAEVKATAALFFFSLERTLTFMLMLSSTYYAQNFKTINVKSTW